MKISKFIKVDTDVLLEWIYDDDNYLTEDYRLIMDTLRNTRAFSNKENTGAVVSVTNNTTSKQLFLLDTQKNKWGIVDSTDTNKYLFLQFQNFPGNVPIKYCKVKLHFPVNYTFKDKMGCLLNVNLFNNAQTIKFPICNYYYDKTDVYRNDINFTSPPFLFQEKLWGKYIELQIPSPSYLIDDVQIINGVRIPRVGSLHKNLVESDTNVLSSQTPIYINFQFITKKENKLGQIAYFTTPPYSTSIPVVPEYEQLGLKIEPSTGGDYFEINGLYNNTISEFSSFIEKNNLQGKRYYAVYTINTYEKNVQSGSISMTQTENFDVPIEFRPIIKYSTTTAILDVEMKLINAVDDSVITRYSSYSMFTDEVGKYSRKLTKIDVKNTYKPKIYNSKPDRINFNISSVSSKQIVNVPVAMMYERYNLNVKNISEQVNDTTYYGLGQNQILLYPSDNVFKFAIANGTNKDGYIPFEIPNENLVYLRFKSDSTLVDVPLYYDSGEINYSMGIVVFMVMETQYETIKGIYSEGFDQFYIVMRNETSSLTTVIYPGRFLLYDAK